MRRELRAVNTAPDSENRMHGDEARRYGFVAGLVPGVDVLAYLAHDGVVTWGADWLGAGRLDGRLVLPVYDGEIVAVETDDDGDTRASRVVGADGRDRATASLSLVAAADRAAVLGRAEPSRFATRTAPEPEQRPPAAADLLGPGTVMATQVATFRAERAPSYLDEISEDHPAFRESCCAHPGWLLRFANWALSRTVRLGPWIHVGSDAWLLQPVVDGDRLEVRAQVSDRSTHKGHELVDLEVLYLVDGQPVAFVDHRAIWQPRPRG